ncbi:chain length-determining protein [Psychromonas sp. psych-6C06]|uniref:chain length-determining protein n=1 Tax=Psychromonas sp. psych-6C06 TaxID=2058089 RepID=UPI000C341610|nr:chain length-determining protein [Psychromonas sp. psych-6C06]PKF61426.1 chain length-determining protein [Psychromonas sp. psych-6C06]
MELNEIFKYIGVVWYELCKRKFKVALTIISISFVVMIAGMFRPSTFTTSITIFADNQNIIKPLLGSKTSVTGIKQNRTTQVRDIIYSPRILNQVIDDIYGKDAFPNAQAKDLKMGQLRNNLTIDGKSKNYIQISYKDTNADRTFTTINKVVSLFIEDSANSKRKESRNAYNFIEQQTASYKTLLLAAESKLKEFQSNNFDGTEEQVSARIASLRSSIEEMNILIEEGDTRIWSLKSQLSKESRFASSDFEASIYHTQLKELQQKKATLQLSYQDDYPAIIELTYQIADLQENIREVNKKEKPAKSIDSDFNPLYKELRSKLSAARVEQRTLNNRLKAFNSLLDEAYERRKRIANNKAELSELTRDYSVFQAQYEDMLAKKEQARISMVLDIQGQGVNFKIQEAATYPNAPTGFRFIHFLLAGPILAIGFILAIFAGKILLDGRIRFADQLTNMESISILASLPRAITSQEKRKRRISNILLLALIVVAMLAYAGFAIRHKYGLSLTQIIELGGL